MTYKLLQVISENTAPPPADTHRLKQGWGTYLLSRDAWIVEYRWRAEKINSFFLNFCLYLQRKVRRKNYVKERERLLLTYCSHVCLSRSFVLTRCCVPTWATKSLMRAMLNVHAGRIWPMGRRFPTPGLTHMNNLQPRIYLNSADDAYFVSELYTQWDLSVWFFAGKGYLSIEILQPHSSLLSTDNPNTVITQTMPEVRK